MSDSHHTVDATQDRRATTATDPAVDLHVTVVQYSCRPDRCTVYPPDVERHERLSTWLSADRDAFVSLVDAR